MVAPKSEGNNTVDDEGNPLWRMAPSPHGPYWERKVKRLLSNINVAIKHPNLQCTTVIPALQTVL